MTLSPAHTWRTVPWICPFNRVKSKGVEPSRDACEPSTARWSVRAVLGEAVHDGTIKETREGWGAGMETYLQLIDQ